MNFALIVSSLVLVGFSPYATACGDGPTDTGRTAALVEQIKSKFGLEAQHTAFRCGGSETSFSFKPTENVVPAGHPFARMNERVYLGGIGGADAVTRLERILALSVADLSALQTARIAYWRDVLEVESRFGIRAYEPNALPLAERVTDKGMLLYVTAAHCLMRPDSDRASYNSASPLGTTWAPVMSVGAASLNGVGDLYKAGDLVRALKASSDIAQNATTVAEDNLVSNSRYCNRAIDESLIDWQNTIDLFKN